MKCSNLSGDKNFASDNLEPAGNLKENSSHDSERSEPSTETKLDKECEPEDMRSVDGELFCESFKPEPQEWNNSDEGR